MANLANVKPEYVPVIEWLLEVEEPWVVYNTLRNLLGAAPESAEVQAAYRAMQEHPLVIELLQAVQEWPPVKPISRAYDPKDSVWKLGTLADFGLRRHDDRALVGTHHSLHARRPLSRRIRGNDDVSHAGLRSGNGCSPAALNCYLLFSLAANAVRKA